ncbi:MAG: FlxA-like family protein [Ruminococcus sp.]|nr:FlxA-like family protein [Ruminococcus sp.]
MTVNGVNGIGGNIAAGGSGMSQASDPVSKNLQRQIAEAQKQLQELSANKDLSTEEKMKKRQELQKTISDLNMQLRQHQIEERRAKQQERESFDDMLGGGQKSGKGNAKGQSNGISTASMEAMISADAAMGQAKVQGSTASKMENRAGVLKAEIALDAGRGGGSTIESKQEELAAVEKKAMDAVSSQMASLAKADKAMENAAAEEGKADADGTKESKTEAGRAEANGTEEKGAEKAGEKTADGSTPENADAAETVAEDIAAAGIAPVRHYVPVDVLV